ncbi:hypothetical protein QTP88_007052 [Uroleucon formosanum]
MRQPGGEQYHNDDDDDYDNDYDGVMTADGRRQRRWQKVYTRERVRGREDERMRKRKLCHRQRPPAPRRNCSADGNGGSDGRGGRGCSAGVHCACVETRARYAGGPMFCASGTATPKAGRATASKQQQLRPRRVHPYGLRRTLVVAVVVDRRRRRGADIKRNTILLCRAASFASPSRISPPSVFVSSAHGPREIVVVRRHYTGCTPDSDHGIARDRSDRQMLLHGVCLSSCCSSASR